MACFGLAKLGIEAKPLHVALGLDNEEPSKNGGASDEGSGSGDDDDDESADESTSDRSSTASGRCRHGVRGGQTVLGGFLPPSGRTRGTVVYFGEWGGGDTAGYPWCRSVRREVRKS
mmetsp:Transcript_32422/g.59493  ORF Transcript_32422/g.59493 Transcript_32422/m.59493 type:complete len:117 (+) Transcript_32422:247-597(+)